MSWDDCVGNKGAWNTLVWFGALIAMATQLRALGLVQIFSNAVSGAVSSLGLAWQPSFALLTLVYFYSHYFFASNIAHVSAMYAAFLAVAVSVGTPPLLAALSLAFFSDMMGTLTQYGMSHGPLYFAAGYVRLPQWLAMGLAVSVVNIAVFAVIGGAWWRFLGIWV